MPAATFIFQDGTSDQRTAGRGRFGRVGLRLREGVDILLQYPLALANTAFTAQSLDGATLTSSGALIGLDGRLSLRLKVEDQPGLYRVVVRAGGAPTTLQFWVYPNS